MEKSWPGLAVVASVANRPERSQRKDFSNMRVTFVANWFLFLADISVSAQEQLISDYTGKRNKIIS